jgi:hypothetical protein
MPKRRVFVVKNKGRKFPPLLKDKRHESMKLQFPDGLTLEARSIAEIRELLAIAGERITQAPKEAPRVTQAQEKARTEKLEALSVRPSPSARQTPEGLPYLVNRQVKAWREKRDEETYVQWLSDVCQLKGNFRRTEEERQKYDAEESARLWMEAQKALREKTSESVPEAPTVSDEEIF